jgi:hypothetical protein
MDAVVSGILIGLFSGVGTSLLSARAVPYFEHRYWQERGTLKKCDYMKGLRLPA